MARFDQRVCEMIKRFNALQATSQSKAEMLDKLHMDYNLMSQVSFSCTPDLYMTIL